MDNPIGPKDPCPYMESQGCKKDCEELASYRKIVAISPTGYVSGRGRCRLEICIIEVLDKK